MAMVFCTSFYLVRIRPSIDYLSGDLLSDSGAIILVSGRLASFRGLFSIRGQDRLDSLIQVAFLYDCINHSILNESSNARRL